MNRSDVIRRFGRCRRMRRIGRRIRIPAAMGAVMLAASLGSAVPTAQAGIMDRVKEIYETPEKLDALEAEYRRTQEELERQREAIEKQQEAFRVEREELKRRNEALAARNESLQERVAIMEREEARRTGYARKAACAAAGALGLWLLYGLSIRLWRYGVWRRQRPGSGGA